MWIASLSNGETVREYDPIQDTSFTPWKTLVIWLKKNNVKMTQLRLQKNGVTVVGIPKADGYVQCREVQKAVNDKNWEETYQGIGSVIGDSVFMTWLNDSGTVKQSVVPLSKMKVHSTLRD